MADNTAKWKVFADSEILYGPSGTGQNLNVDLEKNMGDELDAIFAEAFGSAVVSGLVISSTTGLAVLVSAGVAYVNGQRTRETGTPTISALPPNTTGLKIYLTAASPFSTTNKAWTAAYGFTTGGLTNSQFLLATVNTDGASVTLITDGRIMLGLLLNAPTTAEKAALAGTGVTAPSGSNKYVVNDDARLAGLPDSLTLTSPDDTGWPITVANTGILSLAGQILTAYLAQTITARHTFNPGSANSPFILGANALAQLVAGLNADLLDGQEGSYYQDAANITAGELSDSRLSSNVVLRNLTNTFTLQQYMNPSTATPPFLLGVNAQNQKVVGLDADRLDGQEGAYYQSSTNQNAGTLPDARLSANVGLIGVSKTWTQRQYFSAGAGIASNDLFWSKLADPKYYVRASHSLAQTITNDGGVYALLFNTGNVDADSIRLTNGTGFTVPETGDYLVALQVTWANNSTGYRLAQVYQDGAVAVPRLSGPPANGIQTTQCGAMVVRFTAGQFLDVRVAHTASANLDVLAGQNLTSFSMKWMGP